MNKKTITTYWNDVLAWLSHDGLKILLIFFVTWIISRILDGVIDRIIRKLVRGRSYVSADEEKKREDTLIKITQNIFKFILWISFILGVLYYLGIPLTPLLASAGIFGVAIGFGSQSLVKDIINGLFILAENQFRIGDVITVGTYTGTVEDMSLRSTKLREVNGTIHYIPNAEITIASNHSKDYSMVDMILDVGYDTSIDHAERVINKVGDEISKDPKFKNLILEKPEFLRIHNFSDFSIQLRLLGKVLPKQQYLIEGELRKRFKHAFEEHKIEIPYPTHIIYNK